MQRPLAAPRPSAPVNPRTPRPAMPISPTPVVNNHPSSTPTFENSNLAKIMPPPMAPPPVRHTPTYEITSPPKYANTPEIMTPPPI